MSSDGLGSGQFARWGVLITALMVTALLVGSWANLRVLGEPYSDLETQPSVATIVERATRSLVLSALAGLILLIATGVFWRLARKQKVAEHQNEHQRRLQALGKMSAVMAHEIRNPLASLKGNAQVLAERLPAGGRDRRKADRIVQESKRLESLCQALLDFCRTQPLDRQDVDPTALVHEVLDDLEGGHSSLIQSPDTAHQGDDPGNVQVLGGFFKMDISNAPKRWSLDPTRMRQVLRNLIGNARHVSPAGQPVRIRIGHPDAHLEISIRDHGDGLPAGEEEQIFEPFFTKRTRGTGLGLSVARRVVELHGGTLSAHNAEGGGAEFRISIPWQESS